MNVVINQKVLIVVLVAAIIVLAGYIGMDKYNGYVISNMQDAYTLGYQNGVAAAVQKIMTDASACNTVPVYMGNESLNLVAVECLQQS
jgi:Tfp pilus assembly protein PilV